MRRKSRINRNIPVSFVRRNEEFEVTFDQLKSSNVIIVVLVVNMRSFHQKFSKKIHPSLEVDLTFAHHGPGKIVHSRSERSAFLIQTIMPLEKHSLSIFLSIHKPLIPFLYLQPILGWKLSFCKKTLFIKVI